MRCGCAHRDQCVTIHPSRTLTEPRRPNWGAAGTSNASVPSQVPMSSTVFADLREVQPASLQSVARLGNTHCLKGDAMIMDLLVCEHDVSSGVPASRTCGLRGPSRFTE